MKRLLIVAFFLMWGLVDGNLHLMTAFPNDEQDQENETSGLAPLANDSADRATGTPNWWLAAVEEIDYPSSVTLQTNACENRLAAEAELDAAIADAANVYFSNFLAKEQLKEIVGAVEFLKKNGVFKGRYEVLAVREPTENGDPAGDGKQILKYRGFAHLKFSEELWQTRLIRDRLVIAAVLSWTIISGLIVFSIFLRLNHASRGMHQGRLQIGAIVLFLVMSVLSLWVSQVLV
ncbi:MAG: hypothetical protein KF851_04075 [Pirellulaceae bacterium]|nr:hypothetical protein [Pirellulaceae bacterium]